MNEKNPQMALNLGNELWRYSTLVYEGQKVRKCLHTLQDEFSLNINSILTALFAAKKGQSLSADDWLKLQKETRVFELACSQARQLRRALKAGDEDLYTQAKQHELFLEQCHLAMLHENLEKKAIGASGSVSAMDNVAAYCHTQMKNVERIQNLISSLIKYVNLV